MSKYGWKITADHIGHVNENTYGPRNISPELKARLDAGEGEKQRLYDDDDNLYYEALLIGGDGFEVLDDFGMPNAGCAYVKYLDKGEWRYL